MQDEIVYLPAALISEGQQVFDYELYMATYILAITAKILLGMLVVWFVFWGLHKMKLPVEPGVLLRGLTLVITAMFFFVLLVGP